MGMNLKELAKKKFSDVLSPLMEGREKGEIEKLDGATMTLVDCDIITLDDKTFTVLIFKEDGNRFYFGGAGFTDFCVDVLEDTDLYNELKKDGVKVTLERVTTKAKRTYTKVTFTE